jgi:hypothetical protein
MAGTGPNRIRCPFALVLLLAALVCGIRSARGIESGWGDQLPGGTLTHWKSPPLQGTLSDRG